MIIKLVRHGESLANVGVENPQSLGDHRVGLSPRGVEQSCEAGRLLGRRFVERSLVYCSPYERTRETLQGLLRGAGLDAAHVRIYEDPRLREVEHGYADVDAQDSLRETHGSFYYRFQGGESPADCFDRTSGFLDTLMRQMRRKRVRRALIVTHGLTVRCFVMRFLHLTVEEFEDLANPPNCSVVTIANRRRIGDPLFTSGRWAVEGLSRRSRRADRSPAPSLLSPP
jgi:broad specificity phosphatase PhoE